MLDTQSNTDTQSRSESYTRRSPGHVFKVIAQVLAFIAVCEGAGFIAGYATQSSVQTWYPTLNKPWFTPPDWVFAPVWTMLYALMGVGAFVVWRRRVGQSVRRMALGLFVVQLLINVVWSITFFGMQSIGGGLFVILLLDVALFCTLWAFGLVSRLAAVLLVPYLAWTAYATALNAAIWWMN